MEKAGDGKSFLAFCQAHKIEHNKIKWRVKGDKSVKVSMAKEDLKDGGWSFVSVAVQFALKELGIEADVTFRETKKSLDIIIER